MCVVFVAPATVFTNICLYLLPSSFFQNIALATSLLTDRLVLIAEDFDSDATATTPAQIAAQKLARAKMVEQKYANKVFMNGVGHFGEKIAGSVGTAFEWMKKKTGSLIRAPDSSLLLGKLKDVAKEAAAKKEDEKEDKKEYKPLGRRLAEMFGFA